MSGSPAESRVEIFTDGACRGNHVGAPMPGVIAGIMVKPGQDVRAGDLLLTLEAMKMETALHAERNGRVAEVLVSAGTQVDAKDLLIVLE